MEEQSVNPNLTESVPETKNLNVMQRIIGVFVSPGSTFAHLDRKPDWLIPLILIIIATVIFTYFIMPIALPEQMELQRQKMLDMGMSQEQIETNMAVGERIGKIMGLVGAVVSPGIMMLLFSLFLWFIGNVLLGGKTTFIKMFSVVTYTSLIGVLDMMIKLPLILYKDTMDIHISLAAVLSDDQAHTLMYRVCQALDIFNIWKFVVLAIGFGVIYKFSMKNAGMTMFVLFFIYTLLSVGMLQLAGQ